MNKKIAFVSAVTLLSAAAALAGCGAPKTDVENDFSALAELDQKSDAFSWRMTIVGSLTYGETSAPVKYRYPARYRAFKFAGDAGDQVDIWVRSTDGDAVAWLTDNAFNVIDSNDDSGGTLDSHLSATLPANAAAGVRTYYIIFREYSLRRATFKVTLDGVSTATCDYNGQIYSAGDSFPSTDGCNTCHCGAGGLVGCTKKACLPPTCNYGGVIYHEGDTFPASDGCNNCFCGANGSIGCTELACPPACDPANEPNNSYVGDSPAQCQVIRFVCPAGTTYFANGCGCGCTQPSDCPAWINCMPGPGPSTCAAERARCPYSQVAW